MKYAIVTGGARGLGLGIVRALLDEKAVDQVAVIDLKLAPPPAEIAGKVHGFTADATDEAQVHAAVEAIAAKLGPHPDVLCNNAGGGEANWFEKGRQEEWHSVEIWRRYVELNLNSVYLVSKEVVPRMKSGAAVCNTSSKRTNLRALDHCGGNAFATASPSAASLVNKNCGRQSSIIAASSPGACRA